MILNKNKELYQNNEGREGENNMEKREVMTFEEYLVAVVSGIKEVLPEKYQNVTPRIQKNTKVNLGELNGLVLRGEENITPTIYLESYYDSYKNGVSLYDTLAEISNAFQKGLTDIPSYNENFRYDTLKDKLYCAVINSERNEGLLNDTPHQKIEDLAIVYKVMVNSNEDRIASFLVKNSHLESWGIELEKLHNQAIANTSKLFPYVFKSMNEVISEMMNMDIEVFEKMSGPNMLWVLNNTTQMNGAVYMLNEEVMSSISEELGGDLYVLPSSIHEVIILKDNGESPDALVGMVKEVNQDEVAPEDILSDSVYHFDSKTLKLSRVLL